ncbi:hypothetical protein P872_06045 [Rhodonellum psychrophilum GCM71 = DSM 17998]|uniref:Uncharacterized protein n=1 Tax=Rhodonellum psychrophilum GCM71 = DSM 17998 TaxID=1123057 RepID=U5C4A4_9BACT|nr:hypothetical protein P872_06045 [Rhodonellum psychrophilum GCM71 = DSM 17998]
MPDGDFTGIDIDLFTWLITSKIKEMHENLGNLIHFKIHQRAFASSQMRARN